MITVIDVCRRIGIEPTSSLTWAVGAIVRDIYERRYGCLPEKDLRTKTNGPGSHCFAIYPESFASIIECEIRRQDCENQRQYELFTGDAGRGAAGGI